MRERYVLLGLAPARVDWFRRVGQWATSATIPAEFVRCVSAQEVRARLASGRRFSAALLDGSAPGVDRDLLAAIHEAGVAALVVDGHTDRPWRELGAAATLDEQLTRDDLLDALAGVASMVAPAVAGDPPARPSVQQGRAGQVVAVTGPGGTGASTAAIALAQGLAGPSRQVLLADCCRVADQAMLHDARTVVPSVQDLVDAHRTGLPTVEDIRAQTFDIPDRGYRLLLGLRRPVHWATLAAEGYEATLDSLQRAFDVTVADIESDLEGEQHTGSEDVEARNRLARATLGRATAVVVVGEAGVKGLHALVRTVLDLLAFGMPGRRIVPVLNRSPRSPRERAEVAAALSSLTRASVGPAAASLPSPVFLPRRRVDAALRDGVALPSPLPDLLAGAVAHLLRDPAPRPEVSVATRRIAAGSLGLFTSSREQTP